MKEMINEKIATIVNCFFHLITIFNNQIELILSGELFELVIYSKLTVIERSAKIVEKSSNVCIQKLIRF